MWPFGPKGHKRVGLGTFRAVLDPPPQKFLQVTLDTAVISKGHRLGKVHGLGKVKTCWQSVIKVFRVIRLTTLIATDGLL